jgi:hypothetical protein
MAELLSEKVKSEPHEGLSREPKSGLITSIQRIREVREREATSYSDGQSDGGGTGRSDGPS